MNCTFAVEMGGDFMVSDSLNSVGPRPSDRFAGRTVHGIPLFAQALAADPVLRVSGLVAAPRGLTPTDLRNLERVAYRDVRTRDTGQMPDLPWTGVRLLDVVGLAGLLPEAAFLRVCGGPYCRPIALADAASALLCDGFGAEPLGPEHGGPWRLVVPDDRYNYSVKWVGAIEATAEPGEDTVAKIAVARARARESAARRAGSSVM
jgi:DMSO/TMAO reductase YedYZ molybdopterin-dependent catalytic subunit